MNINEAFTKFIKYQEANNSPATVEAYINRTPSFLVRIQVPQ